MKKTIFILSLLLSAVICFGQVGPGYDVKQNLGNADSTIVWTNALKARAGIVHAAYIDTLTANLGRIDEYPFAKIFTNDNKEWYRNTTATRWVEVLGGATSFITFVTDSSIAICSFINNVTSVCDTFITNINPIQTVTIINDSMLLICDTSTIPICDTLDIPQTNFAGISANNGLRMSTPTNVQLGSNIPFGAPLLQNTYLNTRYQILFLQGHPVNTYPFKFSQEQRFALGTGIASFRSVGGESGQIDFNNTVQWGINYTGSVFAAPFAGRNGYMGGEIAYLTGVNVTGSTESGLKTDNSVSKVSLIAFHTLDTANTSAVDIIGKHPPNANFLATPGVGSLGLLPYRIATFHDNKNVTLYGYPSTRNDGAATNALYTDINGNVKIGPIASTGSVVNILNDTTINICSFVSNVPSLCDTITINNVGNIQDVRIINDSTIEVCGPLGCDTLVVPQANFNPGVTSNNGLSNSTPTNIQLGSPTAPGAPLLHNTHIDAGIYSLKITGTNVTADGTFNVSNTANGGIGIVSLTTGSGSAAIYGSTLNSSGAGTGVVGHGLGTGTINIGGDFKAQSATSNIAGNFFVTGTGTNYAIKTLSNDVSIHSEVSSATTNTVIKNSQFIRSTDGVAGDGIGQSIDFLSETTIGSNQISNQIISKFTTINDGTRVSQAIITGVDNAVTADLFTLSGNGALQLNKYISGNFSGTLAYALGVDASGNVLVGAVAGGPVITADNALNKNTATNVQMGGVFLQNTTIGDITQNFGLTISRLGTGGASTLATVSNTGNALNATSTSGNALISTSTSGLSAVFTVNPSSTNTFVEVIRVARTTSGIPANGIGGSINFTNEVSDNSQQISARIGSTFTDITLGTRTGDLQFWTTNSATSAIKATLAGSGAWIFHNYGVNTFTGTPTFALGVDGSGNVVEFAVGSGGGFVTADNGLSASSATNVQLGGSALLGNTSILTSAFSLTLNSTVATSNTTGTLIVNNTGTGHAVYASTAGGTAFRGSAASTGRGVHGISVDGSGVEGNSTNGTGIAAVSVDGVGLTSQSNTSRAFEFTILPTATNSIATVGKLVRFVLSGSSANGVGGSLDFLNESSSGTATVSALIASTWTDVTVGTRTGDLQFWTTNSATSAIKSKLAGNGAWRYHAYGTGAITAGAAAFALAVDANGNVIEIALGGGGGGTVNSVAGTLNRITSTGGTDPIIDISASYVGQASITTLGTITTGVWTGTTIADDNGGTGQSTYTTGDILYASAANTLSKLGIGATGEVLTVSAGGVPVWTAVSGTGTVTTVSVVSANGFAGTVATATTTPAITISTTITGLIKGNGTAISAAVAGTDYLTPTGSAAALTSFPTFNQNTTGSAATLTTGRTIGMTGDVTWTSASFNGSGNVTGTSTIANDAVTFAKSQDVSSGILIGRYDASTGDMQEITLSSDFTLSAAGELSAANFYYHNYIHPDSAWVYINDSTIGNRMTTVSASGVLTATRTVSGDSIINYAVTATGIKGQRVTTGSISAGASALVTLTWSNAFVDANYTPTVSVLNSTAAAASLRIVHVESYTASQVVVRVENTSAGSLTGTLLVTAIHDP